MTRLFKATILLLLSVLVLSLHRRPDPTPSSMPRLLDTELRYQTHLELMRAQQPDQFTIPETNAALRPR